jgi:AcrR family transcriptional regulator
VSLRTFYRHFASKHDLLFADYDAGLQWFRTALLERSPESILESVQSAIFAFPYDTEAVTQIALRARELDPGRIVRHTRQLRRTRRRHRRTALRGADSAAETSGCTPSSPRAASPRPSSGRWRCGWSGRTVRSTN